MGSVDIPTVILVGKVAWTLIQAGIAVWNLLH